MVKLIPILNNGSYIHNITLTCLAMAKHVRLILGLCDSLLRIGINFTITGYALTKIRKQLDTGIYAWLHIIEDYRKLDISDSPVAGDVSPPMVTQFSDKIYEKTFFVYFLIYTIFSPSPIEGKI